MAMNDEIAVMDDPEDEVVKDAAYFDELRRAVKETKTSALFGTSGLAVYKSIECLQDLELRKQVESVTDPNRRERLHVVYSRYHFSIGALQYITEALPWLSAFIIFILVKNTAESPLPWTTHRYELIAIALGKSVLIFVITKGIQFALWRMGSSAIRYVNGIHAGPGGISVTSGEDHRETDEQD
jgi:hypothetical protein